MIQVPSITEKMHKVRPRWDGRVLRSSENLVVKIALYLNMEGQQPCGQPKKHRMDRVIEDMQCVSVTPEDIYDQVKWRKQADKRTLLPCGKITKPILLAI